MKKTALIVSLIALSVSLLTGCGSKKYADVKKIQVDFADATDTYAADLESAATGADVAKAMNKFSDKMEDVWPKMAALSEKYPELADPSNVPAELKESEARNVAAGQKLAQAYMKAAAYGDDPEVKKAEARLQAIMSASMPQ